MTTEVTGGSVNAPMPGEAQTTPETPATQTAGGTPDLPPPSADPKPNDKAWRQDIFDNGYGQGADKGRREVVEKYGISDVDPDTVRAALEAYSKQTGGDDERSKIIAELAQVRKEHETAIRERDLLRDRYDSARVDRIRAAALEGGVIPDMIPYFVKAVQDRVRWTDGYDIEVLSQSSSGEMLPMGLDLAGLVSEITTAAPAWLAPSGKTGGGQINQPATTTSPPDRFVHGDTRTLAERIAAK